MSRDDAALLAAHVEGDHDAFGELFARHRDRLWAVALRTTGDREEAADALQDAMVSAFRRAGSYRGDAAVTTWLHRIVVNACLDRMRRSRVRAADPLPEDTDQLRPDVAIDPAPSPADQAARGDDRARLLAALEQIPPDMKAALVLVDVQGYPVEEAARVVECPVGTIKSRCARGRRKLAELLGGSRAHFEEGTMPSSRTSDPRAPRTPDEAGETR